VLWQACANGSRISLLCFTDQALSVSEPGTGSTAAINACQLLASEFQKVQCQLSIDSVTTPPDIATVQSGQVLNIDEDEAELETVVRWTLQQPHQSSSFIWISGLDKPGHQFTNLLAATIPTERHVFIDVQEPMLDDGLPHGHYRYCAHYPSDAAKTNAREISINRSATAQLKSDLQRAQQKQALVLAELRVPYLKHVDGDDNVICSLRKLGYLT
jgi:hypothetical protein